MKTGCSSETHISVLGLQYSWYELLSAEITALDVRFGLSGVYHF